MVNFYRNINKLKNGMPLSKKEIENVKAYVKFTPNLHNLKGIVGCIIICVSSYLVTYFWPEMVILSIFLYVSAVGYLLYYVPLFTHIFRYQYNQALATFLSFHLNKYYYKYLVYTEIVNYNSLNFDKEYCLFLCDGYYFYIIEEFLDSTEYFTNKKVKLLKTPDPKSMGKIPFSFKLNDILHFKCNISTPLEESRVKDIVSKMPDIKAICTITLKDFRVLSLGANICGYLRKILPEKELY